jgi:DMSO reductase anchor subunit
MLTLTQLSMGTITSIWGLASLGHTEALLPAAALALAAASVSLASSTLHLGRPVHAYRAVKAWRRSWLSREVLALGLFAHVAAAYAACLCFDLKLAPLVGAAAVLTGGAGVYCSARIYLVPARPSWDSRYTVAEFFLTACLLGPLLARAAGLQYHSILAVVAAASASAQLVTQISKVFWLARDEAAEKQASSSLLLHRLRNIFLVRIGLLLVGGVVLPLISGFPFSAVCAVLSALGGELIGRWLFFTTAVPKNIAAGFFANGRAA